MFLLSNEGPMQRMNVSLLSVCYLHLIQISSTPTLPLLLFIKIWVLDLTSLQPCSSNFLAWYAELDSEFAHRSLSIKHNIDIQTIKNQKSHLQSECNCEFFILMLLVCPSLPTPTEFEKKFKKNKLCNLSIFLEDLTQTM